MTNPAQNATFAARQQERENQIHAAFLMEAIAELSKQYLEIAEGVTDAMQQAMQDDNWRPVQWARQWRGMLDFQLATVEYALDDLKV